MAAARDTKTCEAEIPFARCANRSGIPDALMMMFAASLQCRLWKCCAGDAPLGIVDKAPVTVASRNPTQEASMSMQLRDSGGDPEAWRREVLCVDAASVKWRRSSGKLRVCAGVPARTRRGKSKYCVKSDMRRRACTHTEGPR